MLFFLLSLWETSSVFYKCLSPWKQVPDCKDRADKGISHSHMWPSWELQGFLQEETHWPNKYKPRNLQTNVISSKTQSSRGWVLISDARSWFFMADSDTDFLQVNRPIPIPISDFLFFKSSNKQEWKKVYINKMFIWYLTGQIGFWQLKTITVTIWN